MRTTQASPSASNGSRSKSQPIAAALLIAAAFGLLPTAGVRSSSGSSLFGAPAAAAQNFGSRTIIGRVIDDREANVADATVFLKNLKTRSVKSYNSSAGGSFRFAQVGMVDDYEVWAEKDKKKSAVKTVSSFDSRKELDLN